MEIHLLKILISSIIFKCCSEVRSKRKRNCENCGESLNKSQFSSASFNGSFNPLLSTRYEICLFEDSTWSSKKFNSARIFWGPESHLLRDKSYEHRRMNKEDVQSYPVPYVTMLIFDKKPHKVFDKNQGDPFQAWT